MSDPLTHVARAARHPGTSRAPGGAPRMARARAVVVHHTRMQKAVREVVSDARRVSDVRRTSADEPARVENVRRIAVQETL